MLKTSRLLSLDARRIACGLFVATASAISVSAQQPQPNQIVVKSAPQTNAKIDSAIANDDTPTATVQKFYQALLERRLRDALLMTNLRAAVEPLTAAEMAEFNQDLEPVADQAKGVAATGEQISGGAASVFVKGVDPKTNQPKLDEVKLRRDNNRWTILLGDAETELAAQREGKNYLPKMRLEARHAEVDATLQDLIAAELAYSLKNSGAYADLQTLVKERLMPAEVLQPEVFGYKFRLQLAPDKTKYSVNAEPFAYGKTGKLSFLLESSAGKNGSPRIQNADKNGAPIKN